MRDEDVLEVRLEERGEFSWLRGTRGWTDADERRAERYGETTLRFAVGDLAGDAFPASRVRDLDADATSLARQRLFELDESVRERGWRRDPEPGAHWWSLRYRRATS